MNNNRKMIVVWLVIVILVAIIALGVGIYIGGKGSNKEQNNSNTNSTNTVNDTNNTNDTKDTDKTEETDENKDPKEDVEETIQQLKKSDPLYKELVEKVKKLAEMDLPNGEKLFEKSRDLADFQDVDLVSVAMRATKKQEMKEYYCYNNKTRELVSEADCDENSYSEVHTYVKYADMAKIYKSLYNKELEKKDILNYCPMIFYDKKIDGFYLAYPCGGTGYNTEYHYTYDIQVEENKAYVYVAYGIEECCSEKPVIYTDYARKNKYTGKIGKNFTINEDNYKKFSKYKFIFEKDNDNYYFSRIEQL